MSAFTFTAPTVSKEEQEIEWEALKEQERQAILDDLHGSVTIIEDDSEALRNGLTTFQHELQRIPDAEKMEYLEAERRVPELVQRESNPIRFLRACRYDTTKAANLLVKYWWTRKKIFGPDKAFLPITLDGALADDIEYMQRAALLQLKDDKFGRAVLLIDRIRCTKDVAPRESLSRIWWYLASVLVENESYNKKGYVVVANQRGMDLYKHFDRILTKTFMWVAKHSPIALRGVHLVTGSGASVARDVIQPVVRHMQGKDMRLRTIVHAGSTSEIASYFEDYGLTMDHVEPIFRGSASYQDEMADWIERQREIERAREQVN